MGILPNATKLVVSKGNLSNDSRSSKILWNYEMEHANQLWGRRLREVRTESGFSQKALGIAAGLDQFVASARINRYELGVHKADFLIAQRLAEVLNVPAAFFYTEDDQLAGLMLAYHRAGARKRTAILKAAKI